MGGPWVRLGGSCLCCALLGSQPQPCHHVYGCASLLLNVFCYTVITLDQVLTAFPPVLWTGFAFADHAFRMATVVLLRALLLRTLRVGIREHRCLRAVLAAEVPVLAALALDVLLATPAWLPALYYGLLLWAELLVCRGVLCHVRLGGSDGEGESPSDGELYLQHSALIPLKNARFCENVVLSGATF